MSLTETPSTQTITISSHPIATIEVQYNSLYISGAIYVTQLMTITTSATAVQNNPTSVLTAFQSWNTSISVSTDVQSWNTSDYVFTAVQSWNTSVSALTAVQLWNTSVSYQQSSLPVSISTQTFNSNKSYPAIISANGMTNTSLIVDHSLAPTISSSTMRLYTLVGSRAPSWRSAFSISIQFFVVLMQILVAY